MKWADTILFDRPLRDVCLLTGAPGQDWQTFLQEREATAHENGRREGESALNEQLLHQRSQTIELQRGILESIQRTLPQIVRESESSLIEIALEAAKKIVADMPIDQAMVEAVVREALRQTEDTAEITIQLHPEDLALLRQHQSPLLNGLPEAGPLRFTHSSEISRGGCIIQTRFGVIDARRETKFEQLRQSLAT
ncbi:MAG TPA: FliH/SctL family protein [Verrucomicrobiae bacterium]|nr:FliH/SctL family protein [Verrucomicrobiae bacterium]